MTIRLGRVEPNLSPQAKWSMENMSRQQWLDQSFDSAVAASSPMNYSGDAGKLRGVKEGLEYGGVAKSMGSPSGYKGGALGGLTSAGNWASWGLRGLGAAGLGMSLYSAGRAGESLDPVWDAARAIKGPGRRQAFNRAGAVTADSALSKGASGAAAGVSSGAALAGPVGAAIGGIGGGGGAYISSLARGMRSRQSRDATFSALTPRANGENAVRSAANTSLLSAIGNNPLYMMDPASAAYALLAGGALAGGAKQANEHLHSWKKSASGYGKRLRSKLGEYKDKIL